MLYRVLWQLSAIVTRGYWRLRIVGRENFPASGPFILAPIHRSNVDFLVVALATRRRVRFMAKESLWRAAGLRRLVTSLGAFPVQRGAPDREALRRCIEVLEGGEPLVVFPEGGRRSGPLVEELHEGAAYLAIRAGVPVVPIGVGGSAAAMPKGKKIIRPTRIVVRVGAAIRPPFVPAGSRAPRSAIHELTERLRKEIQGLFDEAEAVAGRRKVAR